MAAKLRPDVVLMDINMPDMDGIAATEQLSSTVPTAAVVMMSVQGEADYLRRSMLAGAREFLVKPFSSDELTASIRQVYARERDKQSRMAAAPAARRWRPRRAGARPSVGRAGHRRRRLQPQGRRRPHDDRGQPGRRRRDRARQAGRPRRRLVPVRRRRRPAQPEPEEQVDRRPRPRARGRRARLARHLRHQPLLRRPRPARAAVARRWPS